MTSLLCDSSELKGSLIIDKKEFITKTYELSSHIFDPDKSSSPSLWNQRLKNRILALDSNKINEKIPVFNLDEKS